VLHNERGRLLAWSKNPEFRFLPPSSLCLALPGSAINLLLCFFFQPFTRAIYAEAHAADPMQAGSVLVSALAQYRSIVSLFGGRFLGGASLARRTSPCSVTQSCQSTPSQHQPANPVCLFGSDKPAGALQPHHQGLVSALCVTLAKPTINNNSNNDNNNYYYHYHLS
jgi:hypothetical protein